MTALDSTLAIIHQRGLLIVFPIAIVEGPIITVVAAYLASQEILNIYGVYAVVVAADLVGDTILYVVGRYGSGLIPNHAWQRAESSHDGRTALTAHFRRHGGKTLIIGKLTHSAGFAILLAAGASRMRFTAYIWYNLLGTLPKSLAFSAVGYTFGYAYNQIDSYIFRGSLIVAIVVVAAFVFWIYWRRR